MDGPREAGRRPDGGAYPTLPGGPPDALRYSRPAMATPAGPPSPPAAPCRLRRDESLLVVVDLQERLVPHVSGHDAIVARAAALIDVARRYGIPAFATEHLPDRIGPTIAPLRSRFAPASIFVKTRFGAADHPAFAAMLASTGRTQAVLCGTETHVCVLQTALGLASAGYEVFVAGDATGSRAIRQDDRRHALDRMREAGCVVTGSETTLFEWAERGDDPAFREVLARVKALP